jgi:squalene-hopene/tetraprenyl-beta-curcumene cyclase
MTSMELGCWNILETNWAEIESVEKHWPEGLGLHVRFNSPLYNSYPYFFAPAFPAVPEESLRRFSLAGMLFSQSLFLFDRFIDEGAGADSAKLAGRILGWQFEAYGQLRRIFPTDELFWHRFRSYIADFTRACLDERRATAGVIPWREFSEERVIDITVAKTGISRTVVAGLASLAADETETDALIRSINTYNVALQYLDDMIDWRKDLRIGTPSLLLIRLLDERPNISGGLTPEEVDRLGREIHYGGHARYMLENVMDCVDDALALVAHLPLDWWGEQLGQLRHRAELTLEDLDMLVQRNLHRVRESQPFVYQPPEPRGRWQRLAWDALAYLVAQSRRGFGEAKHIMRFNRGEGFRCDRDFQSGDVFQRAIIADALCDADEALGGDLHALIRAEGDYLIDRRRREGVGGWSYFPDLLSLCPDADDLAQVIQVLVRSGRTSEAVTLCEKALRVVFEDCLHEDGSFETWIIPAHDRSELEDHQLAAAEGFWGTGSDVEVVANVLYALSIYAPHRFKKEIDRALDFIERKQNSDGSWDSTWYHGPFYGTYVCLRTLRALRPNSPAIWRAVRFLREGQQPDGSWGVPGDEKQRDPLSTALALLGLAVVQTSRLANPDDAKRAERALAFIESSRDERSVWTPSIFIRMDIKSPRGGPPKVYSYGSRTITCAYVMKAAVAWHSLLEPTVIDNARLPSSNREVVLA